jgi:hypothetical protein
MEILPPRTSKTILFSLVDQAPLQVLAVSDSATPEGDVGRRPLLLQLSDDGCRTIAAIRNRFIDPDLVTVFDTPELVEVRLIVMPRSRGDLGVEDDSTVGINTLMHFVSEPSRRSPLLGKCGVRVGATVVRLIGNCAFRGAVHQALAALSGFGLLTSLLGIIVNQGIQGGIRGHQSRVGHHAALLPDQTLLLAKRYDVSEHGLEDLLAIAVSDATE